MSQAAEWKESARPISSTQITEIQYDKFMTDIVQYFYHEPISSTYAYLRARLALLDSIGCAIETHHKSPQCRAMLGPIVPGTYVPSGCRLPTTTYELDPVKASFDLGSMIRYLDHNDGYTGQEWGHPSDMLGAILSVADWKCRSTPDIAETQGELKSYDTSPPPIDSPITMKTVLSAIIKAYEIHCLFQHTNSFNRRGLDHTILVKMGSVVAVSWLLGMKESQALAALSQVFQDGGMLRTYRQAPNTGPRKGWAAGDACMRATHLALITRAGQPGAPRVLSDPKWGFYATLFGGKEFTLPFPYGSWAIEHTGFKLVAAEGHGISACNAALILAGQLRDRGLTDLSTSICNISVRTMKPAITIINTQGPLRNYADRDHCLSYMIAVTLLKNALPQAEDYADSSAFALDPCVDVLRSVTHAFEDPQLTQDYFDPQKRTLAAGLTITLQNGEVLDEVLIEAPLGHSSNPDTNDAVLVKFEEQVRLAFDAGTAEKAISATKMDSLPMSDFMDLFWKGSTDAKL